MYTGSLFMAIYSPLRSRRLATQQKVEATQRLITFKLNVETFAIPLDRVHKVATIDRLYGDPHHSGVSLTTYQGRELVVIDVGHRIFGRGVQVLPASGHHRDRLDPIGDPDVVKYLVILKADNERLVGMPIDSTPSIQSMQISAFQPLPAIYQQHGNVRCVSSFSIDSPDRPSIFLLDVDAIVNG
jgi:chemotaxis signal transduction protein